MFYSFARISASFQKLFGIFRGSSPFIPIAFVSVKPSTARLTFLGNILKFNQLVRDFLKAQPETDYIDVFDLTASEVPARAPLCLSLQA